MKEATQEAPAVSHAVPTQSGVSLPKLGGMRPDGTRAGVLFDEIGRIEEATEVLATLHRDLAERLADVSVEVKSDPTAEVKQDAKTSSVTVGRLILIRNALTAEADRVRAMLRNIEL